MKFWRTVAVGAVLFGAVVLWGGISFAQDTQAAGSQRHEAKIKLLRDSAAALQKSNPDMAKGLTDMADKEAKESQDWKAKHEARVQLLKDAAAALGQSNPDLAKGLLEMTEAKHREHMGQMTGEKNEKEEVGEKTEPKQEQGEVK